jgi:hypothetical protein
VENKWRNEINMELSISDAYGSCLILTPLRWVVKTHLGLTYSKAMMLYFGDNATDM